LCEDHHPRILSYELSDGTRTRGLPHIDRPAGHTAAGGATPEQIVRATADVAGHGDVGTLRDGVSDVTRPGHLPGERTAPAAAAVGSDFLHPLAYHGQH